MEIGQRNSAPMQATALSGRPKVLLGGKKVHSGDPTGAVACMAALLGCPISVTYGFFAVWGQKNIKKPESFTRVEAIMAESETSSSILIVWLTWEHHFSKVVLWR